MTKGYKNLFFEDGKKRAQAVNLVDGMVDWILNPQNCLSIYGNKSQLQKAIARLTEHEVKFSYEPA